MFPWGRGRPLPWFAADTGFGTVSISGLSGEIDSVGAWSMIPALVVTGLFVLTLIIRRWHVLVKTGLILSTFIVALVGILFVSVAVSEDGGIGIGLWMTVWGGIGIGLWMTVWGGIGMVVGSIWGSVKWNSSIER